MLPNKTPDLECWHRIVITRDLQDLIEILSEKVEFRSPFLWEPYSGQETVSKILWTVSEVFQDFTYHREILDVNRWALEFSAMVREQPVKGIDLIEFDENGKISNFEVFVRPLAWLRALGQEMARRLGGRE